MKNLIDETKKNVEAAGVVLDDDDLRWRENSMKLIGKLKKQVENTNDKEEAKKIIADAGMALTDDELDMVAGGERTCLNKPDVHLFGHT